MKRYYPNLSRQFINKTCRKFAKINLTQQFNKTAKNHIRQIKTEFNSSYREKIKAEYHHATTNLGKRKLDRPTKFIKTYYEAAPMEEAIDLSPKRCRDRYIELNSNNDVKAELSERIWETSQTFDQPGSKKHSQPLTEGKVGIVNMSSGRYLNFGITEGIRNNTAGWNGQPLQLTVAIYVHKSKTNDGLEVPRYLLLLGRLSSSLSMDIIHPPQWSSNTFIIGIYQGAFSDLTIANEILRPFVTEMQVLPKRRRMNSLPASDLNNEIVTLKAIVVDPISNSLFTCTALPSSLYGCSKCRQRGQLRFNNSLTSFPAYCKEDELRLDEDFKYCLDNNYHLAIPVTKELGIGLVSRVVIDYKYTMCMGVMKRLMKLWTTGKLDYRINKVSVQHISADLEIIGQNCPSEFRNRPKTMTNIDAWTAYDWRQFLLYHGPIVLENRLPTKYYIHFVCLHLAARIMINRNEHKQYGAFIAGFLLKRFVADFSSLYGADQLDYNIHNLLHYEEVIQRFGSIEDVGGFVFDDQMDRLSAMLANCRLDVTLEQLRQLLEEQETTTSVRFVNDIYLDHHYNLNFNNFLLNTSHTDSYVITTKGIVKVFKIVQNGNGTILLLGQKYTKACILYQVPLTDAKLWLVSELDDLEAFQLSEVIVKGIRYDTARGVCIMPLVA